MKKIILLYTIVAVLLMSAALKPSATFADGGCIPLYNGGVTTQEFCPTPTPIQYNPNSPFPAVNPQTGQPVYPSSKSKTTPNTGPGDWTLISLILAGAAGVYIRKKTNTSLNNS